MANASGRVSDEGTPKGTVEGTPAPPRVRDAEVIGEPGPDVTHWGMTKRERGKWLRCHHPHASGAELREWPLSELSFAEVSARWGEGEYRAAWFIHDPEHPQSEYRTRSGGGGLPFVIRAAVRSQVEVGAPAAPAAALPGGFEVAAAFMNLTDRRVESQLSAIASLANAIAGQRGGGGVDATMLGLLLDKQQAQFASLLQTMQAQHGEQIRELRTELAAVRTELASFEDDGSDGVEVAAKAAGIAFKRGMSFGDMVKAFVSSHPSEALGIVKQVPAVVAGVAEIVKSVQAQQAPRPRARVVDIHTRAEVPELAPPAPPAPPPPAPSGLNAHAAAAAASAPPPTAPPKPPPADVLASPVCGPTSPAPGT